jgi:hypothetical protein
MPISLTPHRSELPYGQPYKREFSPRCKRPVLASGKIDGHSGGTVARAAVKTVPKGGETVRARERSA